MDIIFHVQFSEPISLLGLRPPHHPRQRLEFAFSSVLAPSMNLELSRMKLANLRLPKTTSVNHRRLAASFVVTSTVLQI